MYDVTEYCLSYPVLVSIVQSGAVVTRPNLSQIYTQHCIDSSRTEFILEKHNRHQFLALTGEIWVVCCENLKKIDRVMAVPHCFNPFPVAFGALLWVSLSYDVTSVLMQSSLCTSESDVLYLYVLLCLVVTKKCKYGEIKLCEKKYIYIYQGIPDILQFAHITIMVAEYQVFGISFNNLQQKRNID